MQRRERSASQSIERTDGVLVEQALAGDERAFEILVYRYDASLFACVYRYTGDYDQTCDVLQDVWLQLYRSLPTIRTGEPLGPWLIRVARNRCLDVLCRRRRRYELYFSELEREADKEERLPLASLPDFHPLPVELAEHHELQHALQQAIQALPPKLRTVVLLRYGGQLSFAEIGRVLQMPETTVKTYFYRACPRLAALLSVQRETNQPCLPVLAQGLLPDSPGHSKGLGFAGTSRDHRKRSAGTAACAVASHILS